MGLHSARPRRRRPPHSHPARFRSRGASPYIGTAFGGRGTRRNSGCRGNILWLSSWPIVVVVLADVVVSELDVVVSEPEVVVVNSETNSARTDFQHFGLAAPLARHRPGSARSVTLGPAPVRQAVHRPGTTAVGPILVETASVRPRGAPMAGNRQGIGSGL